MTDNFDLRKYLVENKVTTNSRMLNENESNPSPEEAAKIATKLAPKLENDPKIQKVADAIASDPKAKAELMKLIGMNENVDTNLVKNLATKFAEKASHMQINEEGGFDFGGAFWSGLLGGGTLAYKLAAMGDVITPYMKMMGHSPSHMGAVVLGAIGGAILACVGKAVYDKSKGANESKKSTNSKMLKEERDTLLPAIKETAALLKQEGIPFEMVSFEDMEADLQQGMDVEGDTGKGVIKLDSKKGTIYIAEHGYSSISIDGKNVEDPDNYVTNSPEEMLQFLKQDFL